MKLARLTGALAAAMLMFVAPAAYGVTADPDVAGASTEHKPGAAGHGDVVPADLKVKSGTAGADPTAQPDENGLVPHVCAGRKLLHHAHVDAAYVTRVNGNFTTTVVDGQAVVPDPNTICVRLAPDATNADGVEVSRFVVPNNWRYEFLGEPGTILWRAPQELFDDWRPVWAGIGAFDSHHEYHVPDDILLDKINLRMTKLSGPGDVEVWRTTGMSNLDRGLSTKNADKPLALNSGAHGHWSWTFTQPGVYDLGYQASYTDKNTNEVVTSTPSSIRWLVGSDEEVGLPAGTTSMLNPIKVSAEDQKAQMIEAGLLENTNSDADRPLTDEEARKQIRDVVYGFPPVPPATPQSYIFRPYFADDTWDGKPFKQLEINVLDNAGEKTAKPVIEVPDTLRQDTSEGKWWVLSSAGGNGALNFDFSQVSAENRSAPLELEVGTFFGPERGRYVAGTVQDGKLVPVVDTVSKDARHAVVEADKLDMQHVFSKPGFYEVGYSVKTTHANGDKSYKYQNVYFAVGDATINALRQMTNPDPEPAPEPSPKPEPGDEKDTEDQPVAENVHIITEGHMDQALSYDGKQATAFVEDTADPRNAVERKSGTFAYAVPDSTKVEIPADARGYEELRKAAPEGVWVLPEAQLEGLPWVGFSTLRMDYSKLVNPGVTIELRNVDGPGRFVSGQDYLTSGFVTRLDSAKPDLAIKYPKPTHDHQAMYFTAPGRYTMDFVFVLHHTDGTTTETPLTAQFLVGDKAIADAKNANTPDKDSSKPGDNVDNPTDEGSKDNGAQDNQPDVDASTKLSIDDLVDKLNAEERGKVWDGPGNSATKKAPAAKQPDGGNAVKPASKGDTKKPLTAKDATNESVTSSESAASGKASADGKAPAVGTPATGTSVGTSAPASTSSGDVASRFMSNLPTTPGAAGLDELNFDNAEATDEEGATAEEAAEDAEAAETTEEGADSGQAVTALEKPTKATSALLNPNRGAAPAEDSGTPLWQWLLLALGGISIGGVSGWQIALRK